MSKLVVFSVNNADVSGDFEAGAGDVVLLLGGTKCKIHAWRHGADACNLIGWPCPLVPMTGRAIPDNAFACGDYVIGVSCGGGPPGETNGRLRVGSGPGDPTG